MATIRKRNGKWHVQIRRKNLPSQTCSFVHKNHALKWIRDTEIKLEQQTLGMISTYPTFKSLIEKYTNTITNLEWECEKGHRWFATPRNIKNHGTWCKECSYEKGWVTRKTK